MTSQAPKPHLLKVATTPAMRDFLGACLAEEKIRGKLGESAREEIEGVVHTEDVAEGKGEGKGEEFRAELKFRTLEKAFSSYKESKELDSAYFAERGRIRLYTLLQGSEVYFTPPQKPPRNPELVARLARIQTRLDNQAYNRMVSNLSEKRGAPGSLAIDMKSLNLQIVHAFNILLSFVCAFVFGFAVGHLCELEHTYSALIGVGLCAPVLLADVYFLLKSYEDGAERDERAREGDTRLEGKSD